MFNQNADDEDSDSGVIGNPGNNQGQTGSKKYNQSLIFIAQNDGVPKLYEFDIECIDFKMVKKLPSTFSPNTGLVMIKD